MNTKFWLESQTVQGNLLQVVPIVYIIASNLGLALPEGTLESVVQGISAVMLLVGTVMVFLGRFNLGRSKEMTKLVINKEEASV